MRIGILMGGSSREREISFAGGRTVFDNLDKAAYEAVPIFVDSFRRPVLLNWQLLYKGSIRDFWPSSELLIGTDTRFQPYIEQLAGLTEAQYEAALRTIGQPISWEDLARHIDFAFLTLHGESGEDGSIQGMLQWLGIPYSGSGILGSGLGFDKTTLREMMQNMGLASPAYVQLSKQEILNAPEWAAERVLEKVGIPCVVKHPTQGSSIGVHIVHKAEFLAAAMLRALFIETLTWDEDAEQRLQRVRALADPRSGVGLPAQLLDEPNSPLIKSPAELLAYWEAKQKDIRLQALDSPAHLLVEAFIDGTEFSVIVLEDEHGKPLALPPTEILKLDDLYDYRAKYLPGIARKRTPIELPLAQVEAICRQAEDLKARFYFDVYARLDGILAGDGTVYFNDPNTTSGMLPSSFFFHQAAEIGLSPTGLLTYIIETSLTKPRGLKYPFATASILPNERLPKSEIADSAQRMPVGVLLGGYSSERHISVESGRNIYEKLSSSATYRPLPFFVLHNSLLPEELRSKLDLEAPFSLWQIPLPLLLKDNADDIAKLIIQSTQNAVQHPLVKAISQRASGIRARYALDEVPQPLHVPIADLRKHVQFAFIALHGRPGEDGQIQTLLEPAGIPYNGSGVWSSRTTIDKYQTNELLAAAGFLVAKHRLVAHAEWLLSRDQTLAELETDFRYPLIAKPFDEGCSSAVLKIRNRTQLEAYLEAAFRAQSNLNDAQLSTLNLKPTDEFPRKESVLIEELIEAKTGQRLMEITVGLLTSYDFTGKLNYQVFEPSETPSNAEVLSLEEKFLAGEGQNITPARFSDDTQHRQTIADKVRATIGEAAELLRVEGYCRIDAFVRLGPNPTDVEVVFIEVNSLPGMTPATCIFHQTALAGLTPFAFIDRIIQFGIQRQQQAKPKQIHRKD
jgi:UDP-N-acetylmuramate--alanine ligase